MGNLVTAKSWTAKFNKLLPSNYLQSQIITFSIIDVCFFRDTGFRVQTHLPWSCVALWTQRTSWRNWHSCLGGKPCSPSSMNRCSYLPRISLCPSCGSLQKKKNAIRGNVIFHKKCIWQIHELSDHSSQKCNTLQSGCISSSKTFVRLISSF